MGWEGLKKFACCSYKTDGRVNVMLLGSVCVRLNFQNFPRINESTESSKVQGSLVRMSVSE